MKIISKKTAILLLPLLVLLGWSIHYYRVRASSNIEASNQIISTTNNKEEETTLIKEDLTEKLQNYLQGNAIDSSMIAISIYDIEQQQSYKWNTSTDFISASLYKVPLAMLYYEWIEDGTMQESDTLTYCSTCYEEGGPIGTSYQVGAKIPLSELLYDVIVYSDNTAGHILFEHIGGWNNYRNAILKYSEQTTSFTYIEKNSFTADYAMDVLKTIYLNEEHYVSLLENMNLVYPNDYLNRSLPLSTLQKYGSYGMERNAMGMVYGTHPYLIVILVNLGENGVEVIGDINKIAYETFNAE